VFDVCACVAIGCVNVCGCLFHIFMIATPGGLYSWCLCVIPLDFPRCACLLPRPVFVTVVCKLGVRSACAPFFVYLCSVKFTKAGHEVGEISAGVSVHYWCHLPPVLSPLVSVWQHVASQALHLDVPCVSFDLYVRQI
jgi:hypothetical protein